MMSQFLTIRFQLLKSDMLSFPGIDSTLSAAHFALFVQEKCMITEELRLLILLKIND